MFVVDGVAGAAIAVPFRISTHCPISSMMRIDGIPVPAASCRSDFFECYLLLVADLEARNSAVAEINAATHPEIELDAKLDAEQLERELNALKN